jgi:hypothetical protein
MILIGLFGGSPESREEITRVMVEAAGIELGTYRLAPSSTLDGEARLEKLAIVLRGVGAQVKDRGLLITHVMSCEEADAIRARGGRLLYVQGAPSEVIPITLEDLAVTVTPGGYGHYLDPVEAYSEVLLAKGRAR